MKRRCWCWLSLRFNPIFAAFLLIAFLSSMAGVLLALTLSLFLTTEVKVRPLWVGLFHTANAVAGIIVSFLLAKRSDNRGDRRMLVLLCCLMSIGNCLLFTFNRGYLTLITVGVLLSAVEYHPTADFRAGARICRQRGARSSNV